MNAFQTPTRDATPRGQAQGDENIGTEVTPRDLDMIKNTEFHTKMGEI